MTTKERAKLAQAARAVTDLKGKPANSSRIQMGAFSGHDRLSWRIMSVCSKAYWPLKQASSCR